MQYLNDFIFDGFKVLRINDISKVIRGAVEEFHDEILKSEQLAVHESMMTGVEASSWPSFFESICGRRNIIDMSLEK